MCSTSALAKADKTNENVLSIGNDLQDANGWGGSGIYVIHIFYTKSSNTLQVNCFNGGANYTYREDHTNISGETTIELNSNGLYLNDTKICDASNISNILSLSSIKYGSTQAVHAHGLHTSQLASSQGDYWWHNYSNDNFLCSGIRFHILYLSCRLSYKMLYCYYF